MKRTKFELILAAIFFITGLFLLIFSQRGVTGAAVHFVDVASITSIFVGLLLVFSAVVLFSYADKGLGVLEKKVSEKSLRDLEVFTTKEEPIKEKRVAVLDTGFFYNYRDKWKLDFFLNNFLSDHKHIYTTKEAFNGLKDSLKQVLENHKCSVLGQYALKNNEAATNKSLENTEKAKLAGELLPYLTGKKEFKSHNEKIDFAKKLMHIYSFMRKDGWDLDTAMEHSDVFRNQLIRKYLQHFAVGEGDIGVMDIAEKQAKEGHSVFVYGNDTHLEQGIQKIQKENPDLGKHIHYVKF